MRTKLHEEEKVLYIAQKHWIVYLTGLLISAVIIAVATTFKYSFLGVVFSIAIMLYIHLERKTNLWIVTDRRFIDEYGIISLNSKETPIDKINNVTFSKDIIGMIFGYGDVVIQSAAELGITKAKLIKAPEMLKSAIEEAQRINASRVVIPPDSMQCPVCKEIIKKDALICRYCGYKLAEHQGGIPEGCKTFRVSFQSKTDEENKLKEDKTETFKGRSCEIWRPRQ